MTKRFSENLSPTYKRRNRALISLFEKAEMKVSLLGDLRKPNMIHEDSEDKLAEFIELMESSNQEKVYRIVYGELYYSGLKRDYSSGENYPVFSKQFPKIYYTTDKAIEESYSLRMLGYKTEFE